MSETDIQFEKERNLFLQALEIEDDDLRKQFLNEQCGQDQQLLKSLEALLHNHAIQSSPLDEPLFGNHPSDSTSWTHQPNQNINGYRLENRLGEGGMGEVWVAQQNEPVVRRVALKLIKHGMHTPQILRRFSAERQALAAMDHPNIAKILDGGSTSAGQPFFVMELINGAPLNQFCDQATLTINERLEIFISIANAVQHAHQRAIIHRDLKPSNLLVTVVDGKPVPKIIDFGLAKGAFNGPCT